MRNAMPIRWIEQGEARQVITMALFERAPKAPWSTVAGDAAAQLLPRLGSWLAARHPLGSPSLQPQPALVHQPACRPESLSRCDEGYSCNR